MKKRLLIAASIAAGIVLAEPLQVNAGDVCVSVNDEVRTDNAADGTECESSGTDAPRANVAVAVNGSIATIEAEGGTAIAVNDSTAWIPDSSNNLAVAVNGSHAAAHDGNENRAIAINGSIALALFGNDNSARAINGSAAVALDGSSSSTSINESYAEANGEATSRATAVNCGEAVTGDGETVMDINGSTCFVEG
jgi:hypothetical protein